MHNGKYKCERLRAPLPHCELEGARQSPCRTARQDWMALLTLPAAIICMCDDDPCRPLPLYGPESIWA